MCCHFHSCRSLQTNTKAYSLRLRRKKKAQDVTGEKYASVVGNARIMERRLKTPTVGRHTSTYMRTIYFFSRTSANTKLLKNKGGDETTQTQRHSSHTILTNYSIRNRATYFYFCFEMLRVQHFGRLHTQLLASNFCL